MARPLSEDRRNAILMAATELVAEQGLGAATAEIAKKAGVPNGSIFTYFATKTDLLNALYLELKRELTETVLAEMPGGDDTRAQLRHLWVTWTFWGASHPLKRRVLAQLSVSDQITELSRKAAYEAAASTLELIRRASTNGALHDAPAPYVGALVEAMATTTMDFMIRDPAKASALCESGFEALWNTLH
jgi:AcrR family transcriptional regulator